MMGERRIIPVTPNKRRSPALYELIASTQGAEAPAVGTGTARASSAVSASPAARGAASLRADEPPVAQERVLGLTPGSRLSIPIGFAFTALAVMIGLVLGAYALGYNTMQKKAQAIREQEAAHEARGVIDPTNLPSGLLELPVRRPGATDRSGASGVPIKPPDPESTKTATAPPPAPAKLTLVKSTKDDPRKTGMNYPVVATLPIKEATAAGEYLVARGYATVLAPSPRDSRLFMVIPLTPIDRDGFKSRANEQVERSLKEIGRSFKREARGATDFFDLFWVKY